MRVRDEKMRLWQTMVLEFGSSLAPSERDLEEADLWMCCILCSGPDRDLYRGDYSHMMDLCPCFDRLRHDVLYAPVEKWLTRLVSDGTLTGWSNPHTKLPEWELLCDSHKVYTLLSHLKWLLPLKNTKTGKRIESYAVTTWDLANRAIIPASLYELAKRALFLTMMMSSYGQPNPLDLSSPAPVPLHHSNADESPPTQTPQLFLSTMIATGSIVTGTFPPMEALISSLQQRRKDVKVVTVPSTSPPLCSIPFSAYSPLLVSGAGRT